MHTLAEKVREEYFPQIRPFLFETITTICSNLPCPDCARHASAFLRNINFANIKKKQDLINMLFIFHNVVNQRKSVPQFRHSNMHLYGTLYLVNTYNSFIVNFHTDGNMDLITESFRRQIAMKKLKRDFILHLDKFDLSVQQSNLKLTIPTPVPVPVSSSSSRLSSPSHKSSSSLVSHKLLNTLPELTEESTVPESNSTF